MQPLDALSITWNGPTIKLLKISVSFLLTNCLDEHFINKGLALNFGFLFVMMMNTVESRLAGSWNLKLVGVIYSSQFLYILIFTGYFSVG